MAKRRKIRVKSLLSGKQVINHVTGEPLSSEWEEVYLDNIWSTMISNGWVASEYVDESEKAQKSETTKPSEAVGATATPRKTK